MPTLDEASLKLLLLDARTHNGWTDEPVDESVIRRLYEVCRMGPTSSNIVPLRVVFVKSAEAKKKLEPAMNAGNREKTMAAPYTAILAYDTAFYEKMSKLAPHAPDTGKKLAQKPEEERNKLAHENAWLQAGYFILTARALGLDCGPMLGFEPKKVDEAFFKESTWRSIVVVNLGHGDWSKVKPRAPRLDFEEACRIE